MNPVLRIFTQMLLVLSLAIAPISANLAAISIDQGLHSHNSNTVACHQTGHEQAPANTPSVMTRPGDCCGETCSCSGHIGCSGTTTLPFNLPPTGLTDGRAVATHFLAAIVTDDFDSVSHPPDPPPPVG